MKKVLHISNYYYPHIGGIEQTAFDIVCALKGKYNQKVICFNHEKKTIKDIVDGIEITRVNCQMKISSQSIALDYGRQLNCILKQFNPDIVIFHYPNPFVGFFLEKKLKRKKFKFILYWHLDIIKQKLLKKFFNGQNKHLLKYSDKVITTSQNYLDGSPWLTKFKNKCNIIPSCINTNRLTLNDNTKVISQKIKENFLGKKIVFAFGRHVEYKGLKYLIEASSELDDSYAIIIGGQGPLTNDLKLIAKNDHKIIFIGKISDDELKAYLLCADVFAFPSITKNEAFGLGLAEALYFGVPAVTFTIYGSGVNFVNLDGVTGLEVPNRDYKSFASAIKKICDNEELKNKLSLQAKQRTCDLFMPQNFSDKINSVIDALCEDD